MTAIKTHVAWAGWDEHDYRGHRVFAELAGSTSFSGLLAIAVTGRKRAPEEQGMLDDLAVCMTVAEPRIWPLKLTRLVATYGSAMAGYCAGHAMLDGSTLGMWTPQASSRMLVELSNDVGDRIDDVEAVRECAAALVRRTPRLVGFGVPFRPRDERVVGLTKCVEARGRSQRRYWRLLQALATEVRERRSLEVNIGAAAAAVVLDLDFAQPDVAPITMALNATVFLSNALEGAEQRSPILRTLPVESVRYVGVAPRAVDRDRA